jgi:H+/gluconate symporter-like permease
MDAGVNASALPAISVASLVGFGAVVAALPAFAMVRDAVLGIGGGPLVSLAVAPTCWLRSRAQRLAV